MNMTEGLREALDMIAHNKLRSFLTMLGMIIGVAAVSAVISLGGMAKASIIEEIESLGAGLGWITPNNNLDYTLQRKFRLGPADREALSEIAPEVTWNPTSYQTLMISGGTVERETPVMATEHTYADFWQMKLQGGRFFSELDMERKNRVAVAGADIRHLFFDGENPVGKTVIINSSAFLIIGEAVRKELGAISDGGNDDTLFIPLPWGFRLSPVNDGKNEVPWIMLKADDPGDIPFIEKKVTRYLNLRFPPADGKNLFIFHKLDDQLADFNQMFGTITLVVSLVAGLSLLVSGIGIMNIMLVAITERVKEIGIRKAIGAKRRDILFQFLLEALVVCLAGGGIGLLLGMLISMLIGLSQQWAFAFSIQAFLVSMGVSSGIGLFFGLYPAKKAADLQPVVALTGEHP